VNEIGKATARGRRVLAESEAHELLDGLAGKPIDLPEGAVVSAGPDTCPACGSSKVMWGCDPDQSRDREEIHPLVWDDVAWMADTFLCRDCHSGWIEPDAPAPITWVRPYWIEVES
jgi:hypothetical protein